MGAGPDIPSSMKAAEGAGSPAPPKFMPTSATDRAPMWMVADQNTVRPKDAGVGEGRIGPGSALPAPLLPGVRINQPHAIESRSLHRIDHLDDATVF